MAEANNKIGATITYDSQHDIDTASQYKEPIAGPLVHEVASRQHTPAEQRRTTTGPK